MYVPKCKYGTCRNLSPDSCVWDGPESLSVKAPLKILYERMAAKKGENFSTIINFFTDVLGISDCSEITILDQLESLRDSGSSDLERIYSLYSSLSQMLATKNRKDRSLIK